MTMLSVLSNIAWGNRNGLKQRKSQRYNIFALPAGLSGCAFWRYRIPLNKLKSVNSRLDIDIADNPDKTIRLADIQEHVSKADLISIQSPGYKDAYTLIQLYQSEGLKVVVDYDDLSFDLSPGNFRYAELGIREAEEIGLDGKPIIKWRDMENGFDLKSNQEKYEAFIMCLKKADLITTTTDYLAAKFSEYNQHVAVCPNSIDFDLWRPLPKPEKLKDQIRIGWFGGDSHLIDLKPFKTLLPRLMTKYPQVRFVIQASPVPEWKEIFADIPQGRMEWHTWADLRYYTLFLAAKHWDIGLCPLADFEFNRAKSNIKCLEFAALKVPVVAQNMIPYSNHIKHGITGLLAGDEDDWFEQVSMLVEDEGLRARLADVAYDDAFLNHNIETNCRAWEKAYIETIER